MITNKGRKEDCPRSERPHGRGEEGEQEGRKKKFRREGWRKKTVIWFTTEGVTTYTVLSTVMQALHRPWKLFSQGSTPFSTLQVSLIPYNLKEFYFRQIFHGQQWLWCVLPLMTSQDRGRLFSYKSNLNNFLCIKIVFIYSFLSMGIMEETSLEIQTQRYKVSCLLAVPQRRMFPELFY